MEAKEKTFNKIIECVFDQGNYATYRSLYMKRKGDNLFYGALGFGEENPHWIMGHPDWKADEFLKVTFSRQGNKRQYKKCIFHEMVSWLEDKEGRVHFLITPSIMNRVNELGLKINFKKNQILKWVPKEELLEKGLHLVPARDQFGIQNRFDRHLANDYGRLVISILALKKAYLKGEEIFWELEKKDGHAVLRLQGSYNMLTPTQGILPKNSLDQVQIACGSDFVEEVFTLGVCLTKFRQFFADPKQLRMNGSMDVLIKRAAENAEMFYRLIAK